MRTFIAIEISDDVREKISDLQKELKRINAAVSWVRPDNIHITLKFLGDVKEENVSKIFQAVEEIAVRHVPVSIEVAGSGAFPNDRKPRVVWIGIDKGSGELTAIANDLEEKLAAVGFPKEKRKFSPHLTIGRVKGIQGVQKVIHTMNESSFSGGAFFSDEIVVMKSDLKPTGAIYTPLKKVPLGGNE